jgi:hypothetical protein
MSCTANNVPRKIEFRKRYADCTTGSPVDRLAAIPTEGRKLMNHIAVYYPRDDCSETCDMFVVMWDREGVSTC